MSFIERAAVAACIGALAIALRSGSCGESLWVDELHTAWTVSGPWSEVNSRAAMGNQTPWYYYGLWIWTSPFGHSEAALRAPSVLASSLAAALLVLAVPAGRNWLAPSGHPFADGYSRFVTLGPGVMAGVLLAVEPHALFFGTEARPYAAVLLVSVLAGWGAIRWSEGGSARWAALLVVCVMVGIMLHITSGLILVLLASVAVLAPVPRWQSAGGQDAGRQDAGRQGKGVFGRRAGLAAAVATAILAAVAMNHASIGSAWRGRSRWSHFGDAEGIGDLWAMWPWLPLVIVPTALWLAWHATGLGGGRARRGAAVPAANTEARLESPLAGAGWMLAVAVAATVIAWVVAWTEIAPIWHRRYLVGALPLLCWYGGVAWWRWTLRATGRWRTTWLPAVVGAVGLATVAGARMHAEGTLVRLAAGNAALVQRGERWRSAARFIAEHRRPGEPVMVAAELIESTWMEGVMDPVELDAGLWAYLTYPVRGPYRLEDPVPIGSLNAPATRVQILNVLVDAPVSSVAPRGAEDIPNGTAWILVRRPRADAERLLEGLSVEGNGSPTVAQVEVVPFGFVSVARVRYR